MELEGVVVDVMETWPLQLTVISAETCYHILLDMDTITYHNNEPHYDYPFQPNQHIKIEGQAFDGNFIVAKTIQILNHSTG